MMVIGARSDDHGLVPVAEDPGLPVLLDLPEDHPHLPPGPELVGIGVRDLRGDSSTMPTANGVSFENLSEATRTTVQVTRVPSSLSFTVSNFRPLHDGQTIRGGKLTCPQPAHLAPPAGSAAGSRDGIVR
jgi:hypothetical protein